MSKSDVDMTKAKTKKLILRMGKLDVFPLLLMLAEKIAYEGDKIWAKQLFTKATEYVKSLDDIEELISIASILTDKAFVEKLYYKASVQYFLTLNDKSDFGSTINPKIKPEADLRFRKKLKTLFSKWYESYVIQYLKGEDYIFASLENLDMENQRRHIESQRSLIEYIMWDMVVDISPKTFAKVKRFISMQKPNNHKKYMNISFYGYIGSPEIFVESFDDIDFSDARHFLKSLHFSVRLKGDKNWTKTKALKFVEKVISDLDYYDYDATFNHTIDSKFLLIDLISLDRK